MTNGGTVWGNLFDNSNYFSQFESREMFQGMIYFSADVDGWKDGVTSGNMSNGSVTIWMNKWMDRGTPSR